ncbi:hypothetical protein HDV05_002831 [Chytridiales sp. JEL 0842]|nr:hypothetical protein HDV05_002831 [Chytridiales sp. JEL 0842]
MHNDFEAKDTSANTTKLAETHKKRSYLDDNGAPSSHENSDHEGDTEDDFEVGPPKVVNAFGGEPVTGIRGFLNLSMQRKGGMNNGGKIKEDAGGIVVVRPNAQADPAAGAGGKEWGDSDSKVSVSSSIDGFTEAIVEAPVPAAQKGFKEVAYGGPTGPNVEKEHLGVGAINWATRNSAEKDMEQTIAEVSLADTTKLNFLKRTLPAQVEDGSIRIKIEKIGLTANNRTYVVIALDMGYSKFFEVSSGKTAIPAWTIGTIVQSKHKELGVGTKIYGYLPVSDYYDVKVSSISVTGFSVAYPQLPPDFSIYGDFSILSKDPSYSSDKEDSILLFKPLWTTSFLLKYFLEHKQFFGADAVLISSATSKTSFCLAHLLTKLGDSKRPIRVIGITSRKNEAFARSLGVYTDIVLYENVAKFKQLKTVYVDVAGDPKLLQSLMNDFGENYLRGILVGLSHFDSQEKKEPALQADPSASKNEWFFAPEWGKKIRAELGPREVMNRMGKGWNMLLNDAPKWINYKNFVGEKQIEQVYGQLCDGSVNPNEGLIVSFFPQNSKL